MPFDARLQLPVTPHPRLPVQLIRLAVRPVALLKLQHAHCNIIGGGTAAVAPHRPKREANCTRGRLGSLGSPRSFSAVSTSRFMTEKITQRKPCKFLLGNPYLKQRIAMTSTWRASLVVSNSPVQQYANLSQIARSAGACEGSLACSTCHVIVEVSFGHPQQCFCSVKIRKSKISACAT